MRKYLVAGNWKMHKTIKEAVSLAAALKQGLSDINQERVEILVCPSFTSLFAVHSILENSNIKLGGQNLFWEREGAFTGEVSPLQLLDCGCEYVILGHSERRKYFKEDDTTINKKIQIALEAGLFPIFCIGEVLEQRQASKTLEVINSQLEEGLKNITASSMEKIVIAYEPVWAIGTGLTATPEQAQEVHQFIRGWLKEKFSYEVSSSVRILYGGSVKPSNVSALMQKEDIDGTLVGGASLEANSFVEIVKGSL